MINLIMLKSVVLQIRITFPAVRKKYRTMFNILVNDSYQFGIFIMKHSLVSLHIPPTSIFEVIYVHIIFPTDKKTF